METMPKRHYPGGKIVLCSCLHAASLHVLLAGSHYIDAMQGMHVHACLPLQLVAQTCKCLRDRILKTLTSAIVMSSMTPADVDVRVTELLAGASTGDKLVNTVHQIMVLLRENGLVTSMRLLPSAVGVHPKNRDGTGLNSADVHTLLSNLLEVGFVAERTHCVAIEPANEQELDWNHQLVGSCQGLLGFMKPQTLKALSLCGSHTNFALRIIADGAPHEGPESQKVTVGGRLDVGLVAKVDAALAEHVRQGLNWEVLSSSVGLRWPELLQMIQAAGNATLQKSESELQVLRKTFQLIVSQQKAGIQLDFNIIKKKALSSRPACGSSFAHLYQFALKPLTQHVLYRLQGF